MTRIATTSRRSRRHWTETNRARTLRTGSFAPGSSAHGDVVDLTYGYPDEDLVPSEAIRESFEAVVGDRGRLARILRYAPQRGHPEALQAFKDTLLADLDHEASATMFTNGALDGLGLVCNAFVKPGDVVAVEATTFSGALTLFKSVGANIVAVPTEPTHGLDVEALAEMAVNLDRCGKPISVLYLMPSAANPTGSRMPIAARQKVAELAQRRGFLVIEDDAYRNINLATDPLPPTIQTLAPSHTVHLRTASKALAPGLRLATATAAPEVINGLEAVQTPGGVSPISAEAAARVLRRLDMRAHLEALATGYGYRRDRLASMIRPVEEMGVRIHVPEGGFFLWVDVPFAPAPVITASTRAQGVSTMPSAVCRPEPETSPAVRLAYSHAPLADLDEGARRFVTALRQAREWVIAQ